MTQEELVQLIDKAASEGWKELDLAGLGLHELPREMASARSLKHWCWGRMGVSTKETLVGIG